MENPKPKLDIYIDLLFLKYFFQKKPIDDESKEYELWLSLRSFLQVDNSKKIIDAKNGYLKSNSEFILLYDTLIRDKNFRVDFFKDVADDTSNYKFSEEYNYSEMTNPFSLFFVEFPKDSIKSLRKYGFVFITSENYIIWWNLLAFNPSLLDVNLNNTSTIRFDSWDILKKYRVPITSILIFDAFLLDKTTIEYNIKPLLKNLIWEGSKNIDISIITAITKDELQEADVNKRIKLKEELLPFLKSTFPNTNFNIESFRTKFKIHDRGIITNYFFITSGHSFCYFDENGYIKNQTTINFNPMINKDTFESVCTNLKYLKKRINKTDNSSISKNKLFFILNKD